MTDDLAKDLVPGTDQILREEIPKFDFANPPIDPIELAHILAQSCLKYKGLGLSAPQIGLRHRACIINANPMICMINPNIVGMSEQVDVDEEGCLSFPNLVVKVKRHRVIRVRYAMPNADIKTERFEGMTARIIQHEVDHLNGILFTNRASPIHVEQARKRKRRLEKANA